MFLVSCLMAMLGPWIILRQHHLVDRAEGNSEWPHVTGMIAISEVIRTTSGDGGNPRMHRFRTRLAYVYSVDGQTYRGHRHSFETPSAKTKETLAGRYPVGREVDVYYDPRDPGNSVLQRGEVDDESSVFGYVLGGFVTAVGWSLLAFSLWISWLLRSSLARPTCARATFNGTPSTRSRHPIVMGVGLGVGVTLGLVLLFLYASSQSMIPLVREWGDVIDFADEDSAIGAPERPPWRGSKWIGNARIHKMRIFVAQDIEPLARHASTLTNLEQLNLRGTQVSDLAPLEDLKGLTHLDLSATHVRDLTPLKGMSRLQRLILTDTETTELAPLADLRALGSLVVTNTAVRDLSPVARLNGLGSIELSNTQVSDLNPLAGLPNLRRVHIDHTQVSDLSPLIGLRHLERLAIDGTQLRNNLQVIANLSGLTLLDLRTAEVTAEEVAEIKGSLPGCYVLQ